MRAKIKLMKKEAYATLQRNYKDVHKKVLENPDDSGWLQEYLGYDPFEETNYTFNDFELEYASDYNEHALENAIKLYEAFRYVPALVLYSHYFWSWLIFEKAYKQTIQCYQLIDAETLRDSWFPEADSRRAFVKSALAREFISVKMTYDATKSNPYELTPCLLENRALYNNLVNRNISDLPQVTHAVMNIEKELRDSSNLHLNKDAGSFLMKEASKIGSVMLIDIMSESEIELKLREKFNEKYPAFLLS